MRTLRLAIFSLLSLLIAAAPNPGCECPLKHIELSEDHDKERVSSPAYPRPYCGGLDCVWMIETPTNGSLIRFHSPSVDLRDKRDYILFYDGGDLTNPTANCTGRRKDCEYISNGRSLSIRLLTTRGVPDRYGFMGSVTLFDDEFDDIYEAEGGKVNSSYSFFLWILLAVCVIVGVAALIYFVFIKKSPEDNGSPLLEKSENRSPPKKSGEETANLSLKSPTE